MSDEQIELQEGEPAPEIAATVTGGGAFRLSDQRGSWVVVYFYPRANTPGWTHEAKDFQEHKAALEALGALVVGVSADKPEVQQRFIDKFNLTFPMISDTERVIIEAYGTRKVLGVTAERTTFLIDPEGRIARIWRKVKVQGHADAVVDEIERLRA